MQADFFKMPGGSAAITEGKKTTQGAAGNGNVPVSQTYIPSAYGSEIIDISNTKNLFHQKPDGSRVYRVRATKFIS